MCSTVNILFAKYCVSNKKSTCKSSQYWLAAMYTMLTLTRQLYYNVNLQLQ